MPYVIFDKVKNLYYSYREIYWDGCKEYAYTPDVELAYVFSKQQKQRNIERYLTDNKLAEEDIMVIEVDPDAYLKFRERRKYEYSTEKPEQNPFE